MSKLGEGIALAALIVCCAWMDIAGKGAGNLWVLVVIWALFL